MKSFSSELPYFCLFIISLWLSGTIFERLLRCRLLGELLIGLLFGNLGVGTLLPADKTVLVLVGEIGLLALLFEVGLNTDLRKIVQAGPRAAMVAIVGTILPLLTGFGFIYLLLQQHQLPGLDPSSIGNNVIEALASGASLASTSIACAVSLMKQQGLLDSDVGTLITTAALLDDVASLILLGIVSGIGSSRPGDGSGLVFGAMMIVQPVLASIGILLVGLVGRAVVARCLARMNSEDAVEMQSSREQRDVDAEMNNTDEELDADGTRDGDSSRSAGNVVPLLCTDFGPTMKLGLMIIVGIVYSILAEYLGSSRLLGAFVAGIFFSPISALRLLYEEQITHRVQPAMTAIFFATIGFAIPLTQILDLALFGWGTLYAVIASLSKLVTMFLAPASTPDECTDKQGARWLVGTAMVARGELGLLMVQQALLQGVIGRSTMVVTTWSIVLCTLAGIGALSLVMKNVVVKHQTYK
ncbi:hypothetical protein BGZ81_010154 [Podila clonocystis]|nr:hypothetical protein BGZ81_010154 [Podila clonocystis]